ncbi:MAG: type VII secretion protein EssC [Firmicutes bacterium]|nr:type VII secretion protein EssC [Bacillota bacterium]
MDKNRAWIHLTLYRSPKTDQRAVEADLEVPLSITAEDLKEALSGIYQVKIEILKTEYPYRILAGKAVLSETGLRNGTHLIAGPADIEYLPAGGGISADFRPGKEYPRFTRNTRIRIVPDQEGIEILDPPKKPEKRKEGWLLRLLPAFSMLITAGALAVLGGGRMLVFSVISGMMAIISSVGALIHSRKEKKANIKGRTQKYKQYIANKQREIELAREKEKKDLEKICLSLPEEEERILRFSPHLFDRTPEDDDFLLVRLGSGSVPAVKEIICHHQERLEAEDELFDLPGQLKRRYQFIPDSPVTVDLKKICAMGVVGKEPDRYEILKEMLIDLCSRQYCSDLCLILVAGEKTAERIRWARFFPHVFCEELGMPAAAATDEYRLVIYEYLYKELSEREQIPKEALRHRAWLVVFLYEDIGFMTHPVSRYVEKARELSVTFIFFKDHPEEVPVGCQYILEIKDERGAVLIPVSDSARSVYVFYPRIPDERAEKLAKILAPVYTEEISLEGSLSKNYSLFEMLGIHSVRELDLSKRWKQSDVTRHMAAPIGISKTGILELDLSEQAHGPHGLIAGMTGSGKSELLQTLILSLSALFHPFEVGFVIIDFKGGGMAGPFRDLPHLIGTITNIDDSAVDRSLRSIKAELTKRQKLFHEANVSHIDQYIYLYKAGKVSWPMPHLIIIVDEFAELKAEQPEFMKEVISAARIGRSLGVHLILATQKPAGQVSEQIWSNSRFRICLKVQSKEDSNEVLKSPLAAEIREPGRACFQVGNNEIFELFQSAYSGSPLDTVSGSQKEFVIYQYTETGKRTPVYVRKNPQTAEKKTQLEALVRHIRDYAEAAGIRKLPDICLPELSKVLNYPDEEGPTAAGILCRIGVCDDPDEQYQGEYFLDFSGQNVMMIGSSQSGKTNLLQTMIRSLASRYSPQEVNIYLLDFASMSLKNFETLSHVGGVVTASEDEKLKHLFRMLLDEIPSRKEKLLRTGVSSFEAYREAGRSDLPQIVLMIDNLTVLKELYLQDSDELLTLCREGASLGISVIVANSHTQGIGYRYLSSFGSRIAFFCHDTGEYSALFDHCRERLSNIPGRALIGMDKKHPECQVYLAFQGEKEIERAEKIREFIRKTNQQYPDIHAPRIPVIPDRLRMEDLCKAFPAKKPYQLPIGLDYETVKPFVLNLAAAGTLALSGRDGGGYHERMIRLLQMTDKLYPGKIKVYVVDGVERRLEKLRAVNFVRSYTVDAEASCMIIRQMEEELKKRYELLVSGDREQLQKTPLLVLLMEGNDPAIAVQNSKEALTAYRNIVGRYKNLNVCIFLLIENMAIPYSAPDMLRAVRDNRHILFFDNLADVKIFDPPLPWLRTYKKPLEQDDGYYMKGNEIVKLKTPRV